MRSRTSRFALGMATALALAHGTIRADPFSSPTAPGPLRTVHEPAPLAVILIVHAEVLAVASALPTAPPAVKDSAPVEPSPPSSRSATFVVKTIDRNGQAFPGVIVQILSSRGLPLPPPQRTGPDGTTAFTIAPDDGYSIAVSAPGYLAQTSRELAISANTSKEILFRMQPTFEIKVRVTGTPLIDPGDDSTHLTLTDALLDDLPLPGRSYQAALKLAPGVLDADGDGNPNVHGGRSTDFHMALDGVSNVDPLTGTFMNNVNQDAIQDMEVFTTGAPAEFGLAVGGFGKIATKQGSNSFDGGASLFVRSSFFDGSTVGTGTDVERVTYHDVHPTVNVTGPIVRDRLFFALFHEYIDQGRPLNLEGSTENVVVVSHGSRSLDKVTWEIDARNKLVFQAQSDPFRRGPLGIDALTDPASGYDREQGGPVYQIHWDAQPTNSLSIQSLVGLSRTGIALEPISRGVRNGCGIDAYAVIGERHDPFGHPGGEPIDEDYCFESRNSRHSGSYFNDYSDDRVRYTVRSDATYQLSSFLGTDHVLKAGVLAEKKAFSSTVTLRGFSVFDEVSASFMGLDHIVGAGGGTLTRRVSIPGFPDSVTNSAEGSNYGVYIEDLFRPRRNVTVRAGLRVDEEILTGQGYAPFDPAAEFAQFQKNYDQCTANNGVPEQCARANWRFFHKYENYPIIGNAAFKEVLGDPQSRLQPRRAERLRISSTNVSPRLSLSWDPGSQGKTKIFATAGRYYGETFLAVPLYERPPDTFLFSYHVIADDRTQQCRNDPDGDGTICVKRPEIEADSMAKIAPATIRQVDRNLRTPYQDEYTLGISREIFQETSVTITAIRRRFRDQFQDVDVNHMAKDQGNTHTAGCIRHTNDGPLVPVDTRPDGEFDDCGGQVKLMPGPPPFHHQIQIELPDGVPDIFVNNPFFNQVNLVGNFNETDYRAYQFEITRRFHRSWELEASYVWSKATGNAEEFDQTLGNDPTTVDDEFGYLAFDQRHAVKVNVRAQLPLWNLRLGSTFGWQSGLPYSIVEEATSFDAVRKFGTSAIGYPELRTTFPTHRRNDQRNDGTWAFDVGVHKDLTVGSVSLDVSLDVLNLLNSDTLIIDVIRNGQAIATRQAGRQYQLGAKMTF